MSKSPDNNFVYKFAIKILEDILYNNNIKSAGEMISS
jgi:hypothetical protein